MDDSTATILEKLRSALTYDDEKVLEEVLEICEVDSLKACLTTDAGLFIQICARGFLSAATYFLQNCVINMAYELKGRTALQWACLRGHIEIVELLLPLYNQTDLSTPAWQENSEFYSASLGGHLDIVQLLTERFPDVLRDPDILQALLYASCVGGHLQLVHRWLLPSLDINQPVQLVESLRNCEHRTPLHAACEGSHTEVAKLLIDHCGADIMEHTARQFPHFTAELIDQCFHPLGTGDQEGKYNLRNAQIHLLHPEWIKPDLSTITHMNLSQNKLKQLDACVPWAMRSLVHLDVSHNRLVKLQAPDNVEDIVCHGLEVLNASHNALVEVCTELLQQQSLAHLNLSHNSLQRLQLKQPNSPRISTDFSSRRLMWDCPKLVVLNLSYNQLDVLPGDIKFCTAMEHLDISHNKLCSLPSPWACKLEYLDASHNELERFPPSTEQFWSGSLTHLMLNNNHLDQIPENILKLGMLQKLNASHNSVQYLAPPHLWDCPSLVELNLSHNCLEKTAEFPAELLSEELRVLNLSSNKLSQLPVSVCYIKNLANLDISNNPMQDLPKELGNLRECWELKLTGLNIQKPDLQKAIKSGRPVDVIEYLRNQLRKVQPCHIMKVLVVGPQSKGKSTVIESLMRANVKEVTLSDQYVTVTTFVLKSPSSRIKIKDRADNDRPDLTLRIWELSGHPDLLAFHPVFWSENSLFLLVWDMTEGTAGLCQWLCNIRSRLDRVGVIIVATFRDRIPKAEVDKKVNQFHADINALYRDYEDAVGIYPKEDEQKIFPHLCSVVFSTRQMVKQDVAELRSSVYTSALKLIKVVHHPVKFVVGQMLPQSFLAMDKELVRIAKEFKESKRPPYLSQEEFDEYVRSLPVADFDMFDDRQKALELFNQLGSVQHYDVWAEGLCGLYFLDPSWLASMIAAVLMPTGVSAPSKQPIRSILQQLSVSGFPSNILGSFLQLLKHFDIGAVQQDSLFLPCRLPRTAPGLQLSRTEHSRSLLRFYAMPHVPSRLWSRLILSVLLSMDRFSQSWQGLRMEKPQMMYWQEGLIVRYGGGGSIVVESAVFQSTEELGRYPGILISILTESSTLADLAVIGFITDEIDSVLQNIFPNYNDNTELFGIYALCPVCFRVQPCEGIIQGKRLHFALADCAGNLLRSDYAHCHLGSKVALEDLVPEFLMGELPQKFHVHSQELELRERLGGGAVGTVHKGLLRGRAVAVKIFYNNFSTATHFVEDSGTPDSGTDTMSSRGSSVVESPPGTMTSVGFSDYGNFKQVSEQLQLRRQDSMDGRNLKICKAFSELRQEIVILSQLSHPCLISLLGVSVRPSLLVALELAPLGSLRSVLDRSVGDQSFNKYHYNYKDKTFNIVLEKEITFKIVYQIGVGLEYLHNRNILYRDLKSDNVLVCSVDTNDVVNIKLSDYGISKFTTSQGMVGMVGTPGYMAPEIMDGQAYDEKVDIFSFSMVIYELLTGHPPFEKCGRLHQIHQIVNSEKRRPSLKEYNVISNFPYMEKLMEDMWEHDPHRRPSATAVVRRMEDVGFLLQHSHVVSGELQPGQERSLTVGSSLDSSLFCNVTCAWASSQTKETASITNRNNCWVWESPSERPADRRLTIYNLSSGRLRSPISKNCPGRPVTCMAKIGHHMWVGVQGGSMEVLDLETFIAGETNRKSAVQVGQHSHVSGEDYQQGGLMEIYGSSCIDLTKGKDRLSDLEADPVAIIHDKNNPKKREFYTEGEGFAYIGLSDGTIRIYLHHRRRRGVFKEEWRCFKTLTVTTDSKLEAMCFVPSQRELLIGCGHTLIIISTKTLLVEKKICLMKEVPPSVKEKITLIGTMIRNDTTLWCSFQDSPLILELEMSTWKVSGAYCLEADLEVYITDVKLGPEPGDAGVCQICGVKSSSGSRPGNVEVPSPPPRPPKSTKPPGLSSQQLVLKEVTAEETRVQLRPRPQAVAVSQNGSRVSSGMHDSITTEKADDPKMEELRKSLEMKDTVVGSVSNRSRSSTSSSEQSTASGSSEGSSASYSSESSNKEDDIVSSLPAEAPPRPPRRSSSVLPRRSEGALASVPTMSKSSTLPNLSTQRRPPPGPPRPDPNLPTRRRPPPVPPQADSNFSTRRRPPPIPPPDSRRSLPSEHDGVHVQSLLCVKDTLWVGSSCGEILVIGIQKRNSLAEDETNSSRSFPLGLANTARMSLNLESKQMCNLKSVKMNVESEGADAQPNQMFGGIQMLIQARNLVVAVCSIAQTAENDNLCEISVWEACSAKSISSVRQHWQSLHALKSEQE